MQQQQYHFLGRHPIDGGRREALLGFLQTYGQSSHDVLRLEQRHGLSEYMRGRGFSEQEIEDYFNAPEETRLRLLGEGRDMPDLVGELRSSGAPSNLLEDVQHFGDVIANVPTLLALDRCEGDDGGSFAISYHLPEHRGEVAEGDHFFAGVSLSGNVQEGTLTVAPRVVRQICINGMIATTNKTGEHDVFSRDAQGVRGDIPAAVESGLSCQTVTAVVERMRQLKAKQAEDPVRALEKEFVVVPSSVETEIRRVYQENAEYTAYGAFNALTQTARDVRQVGKRVRLEKHAGLVLGRGALVETRA